MYSGWHHQRISVLRSISGIKGGREKGWHHLRESQDLWTAVSVAGEKAVGQNALACGNNPACLEEGSFFLFGVPWGWEERHQ